MGPNRLTRKSQEALAAAQSVAGGRAQQAAASRRDSPRALDRCRQDELAQTLAAALFRNTVVIMTSNIGSPHLLDGVTGNDEIERSVGLMVDDLRQRLADRQLHLTLTDAAQHHIAEEGLWCAATADPTSPAQSRRTLEAG